MIKQSLHKYPETIYTNCSNAYSVISDSKKRDAAKTELAEIERLGVKVGDVCKTHTMPHRLMKVERIHTMADEIVVFNGNACMLSCKILENIHSTNCLKYSLSEIEFVKDFNNALILVETQTIQ